MSCKLLQVWLSGTFGYLFNKDKVVEIVRMARDKNDKPIRNVL